MDKCKCLKENWIGWTTVKCCNLCGNPIEKFWEKQQTPITPESLEGIGFENRCGDEDEYNLEIGKEYDYVNLWFYKEDNYFEFMNRKLYFASTEQIQEWLKPFQSGVAEEVR